MDHIGVKARSESAKLVIAKIKEMCGKDPVILSGDFNVDQTSSSYAVLHNSGVLQDSYEIAEKRFAWNGTFSAFDPDLMTTSRIDHVFVSPSFSVKKYGVLTHTYRSPKEGSGKIHVEDFPNETSFENYESKLPSDHFSVLVELVFNKSNSIIK